MASRQFVHPRVAGELGCGSPKGLPSLFFSSTHSSFYDLILKAGKLQVHGGRSGDLQLVPLMKDFFLLGDMASIQFVRNSGGATAGLKFSTDQVLNLKFARLRS